MLTLLSFFMGATLTLTAGLDEFSHPPVNFNPGSDCGPEARKYQGIPGIERSPRGRLWAVWYAGKVCEDQYNYVVAATSADDGKTWSDLKFIIDPDGDGPLRASDPCLWLDPDNRLWLFWWVNRADDLVGVTMAMTTDNPDDENPTWSAPRAICKGVKLNKPVVTKAGEWILPTAIWFRDGSSRMFVSADEGKTWTFRGAANVPPDQRNYDESMIVERKDGSLFQLIRTMYGIGQSISTDGGRTWSEATNYLPNATSRFFLRRLASGNLLLVKHGSLDKKIARTHLTAYLSDDDGLTWKGGLLLDERSEVSYPDGTQSPDGTISIIYDWNRADDKNILMAVFTEADVLAGKFQSEGSRSRVLVNQATGFNPKPWLKKAEPLANDDGAALLSSPAAEMACPNSTLETLNVGSSLFANRNYAASEIPEALRGCKFYRGNIEGLQAVCRKDGVVYVITPLPARNPDSLSAKLLSQGFQKSNVPEFLLFADGAASKNMCSVYQKQMTVGESLEVGKWGVLLVPASD